MYNNNESIQITSIEEIENHLRVSLSGEANISNAVYIHSKFLEVINNKQSILLDMTLLRKVDTSFLQILFALRETAKISNIDLKQIYLEPEHPLMDLAVKLGQNMYSFDHLYGIAFDTSEGDAL